LEGGEGENKRNQFLRLEERLKKKGGKGEKDRKRKKETLAPRKSTSHYGEKGGVHKGGGESHRSEKKKKIPRETLPSESSRERLRKSFCPARGLNAGERGERSVGEKRGKT